MATQTELLMQAEFQASNETMYWNQMANDKNTDITKQLLSVAALLIPLTGSIVLAGIHLNDAVKTVLIGSLFFFFTSIVFGFIDIFMAARFFREYTDFNAKLKINFGKYYLAKPLKQVTITFITACQRLYICTSCLCKRDFKMLQSPYEFDKKRLQANH